MTIIKCHKLSEGEKNHILSSELNAQGLNISIDDFVNNLMKLNNIFQYTNSKDNKDMAVALIQYININNLEVGDVRSNINKLDKYVLKAIKDKISGGFSGLFLNEDWAVSFYMEKSRE